MSLDQMLLANSELRHAVETRLAGGCCDGVGQCHGEMPPPSEGAVERWREAIQASAEKYAAERPEPRAIDLPADMPFPQPDDTEDDEDELRLTGDSLLHSDVHPTSQAFYDLCDGLKRMHAGKSRDYGCPSGTDPLANIRNGAKFVGIPAWKAAMVRLSDKVTRLATFNATGSLHNEGVIDTLEDLASYSLLALLLYLEEQDK